MAITVVEMQDALGRTPMSPLVMRYFGINSTYQEWYIHGGAVVPGRVKTVRTTAASNAATQAGEVLTALKAGPA